MPAWMGDDQKKKTYFYDVDFAAIYQHDFYASAFSCILLSMFRTVHSQGRIYLVRGPKLFQLWAHSPTVARKKWKSATQIAKNRKWRYWPSKSTVNNNSKISLLQCPTITALVAAFDAKAFNDTELLKSYLAGGNRIVNFLRQTSRKRHG